MLFYKVIEEGNGRRIALEGDIDIDAVEVVKEEVIPAASAASSVVIDFANIRFVDSTGIGLLIDLVQTLRENGVQELSIANVSSEVTEVFQLLQLPLILGEDIFR
ncbi:STAS domain-containing protein [Brevibacillus migulae]|uniref:STAS domain-containing protein n=1 Tax=Brevibacillus migulae TaxID=1644114 RepID=UPI00106E55E7|nr:STAS domain-containing protein [Brevibacillus migulae]